MKKTSLVVLLLCYSLLVRVAGQSIPSFWAHLYSVENYHKIREGSAKKITAVKTWYEVGQVKNKEKWIYTPLSSNKVQGKFYRNNELETKFAYEFDNQDRKIKSEINTKIPSVGWQKHIYEVKYSNGNKILEKHYDGKKKLIRTVKFEYDSAQHPVKVTIETLQGQIKSFETADYDYRQHAYIYKVFDEEGRKVLEQTNFCNTKTDINKKNDAGDLVKFTAPTLRPAYNGYYELNYTYDVRGNWTKIEEFITSRNKKETQTVTTRVIEYVK